jgi:hypothetical protein
MDLQDRTGKTSRRVLRSKKFQGKMAVINAKLQFKKKSDGLKKTPAI